MPRKIVSKTITTEQKIARKIMNCDETTNMMGEAAATPIEPERAVASEKKRDRQTRK